MKRTITIPIDKNNYITVDVEYDVNNTISKYTIPIGNLSNKKAKNAIYKLKSIYDGTSFDSIKHYFIKELKLERKNKLNNIINNDKYI